MTFELRFTDTEITAWGGMVLMKRMLEHMEFDAALSQSGLPQPGSNRYHFGAGPIPRRPSIGR